jgi:hypothetical protein
MPTTSRTDGPAISPPLRVVAVLPVFNDWEAADLIVTALAREFSRYSGLDARILLVDDGSTPRVSPHGLPGVDVLVLRRNLGHQRAIAVGLAWLNENIQADAVLVMDADGEDRPEDVPTLVAAYLAHDRRAAIFARRRRRLESPVFRAGYLAYRVLHRMLTGIPVRIGNFSLIPADVIRRLAVTSDVWSHYAAAAVKSRIPIVEVPIDRGRRMCGRSRMNLAALAAHGLSAISVFGDVVGTRLLVAATGTVIFAALLVLGGAVLHGLGYLTLSPLTLAVAVVVLALVAQTVTGCLAFALVQLARRDDLGCIPARDYRLFVQEYRNASPDETRRSAVRGI